MTDVRHWLLERGFEHFADLFEENEVDGEVLFELNSEDLKDLGIPLGSRKKLLKALANSKDEAGPADDMPAAAPANAPQDAERRQLTVMFVDLVGSTSLSGRIDPEDMREVITGFQNAVAGVVTRFEGQVAKYMGDGVLCYFGWPRAHEDDAERAVRAGAEIMHAITAMRSPVDEVMSARAGIATGLVVVGDLIGEGAAQEEAVVGETPNLAARMQQLASPGQVVVAETTRPLLGNVFELTSLGEHDLKGIPGPTLAHAVTGERAAESRFEARLTGAISEMVGRDRELALMMDRWDLAIQGEGQLVLLSGEAGIGKSRITQAMIDAAAAGPCIRISFQCSPYHIDSSLYPAIQQLTFAAGINPGDSNDEKLDKLEAVLVVQEPVLIASLLGLETEARYGPLEMTPQQQRARTLQALVAQLISVGRDKPVLFVLEDAHWIDASTLELMDLCLDQVAASRVMMLVTARPTFEHGFGGHPIVTKLALNRLGRDQVLTMVTKVTRGKTLPAALLDEIAAKTDGVPLFVEELTKTVLESGDLKETEDAYELTGPISHLSIPSTLHDSLMARLDRLQPIKEVAQTAACIGREFSHGLLAAIANLSDAKLQDALDQLVAAELIFRRSMGDDVRYIFKHALVRDAAYESLLRTRRQAIHGRLVDALEAQADSAPELLAYHCEHCNRLEKAMTYWRAAGDAALARPAYVEAISHFSAAVALVEKLDQRDNWQEFELELELQLAQVYLTKFGYGSAQAAKAYAAAHRLLHHVDRPDLLVPVSYGIWIGHYLRGEHSDARPKSQQLVEDVEKGNDAVAKLVANRMAAATLIMLGEQQQAQQHLDHAFSLYQPDLMTRFAQHFAQDPGVQIRAYLMLCQGLMGFTDQALTHVELSRATAEQLNHVNTTCYGALHWSVLGFVCRDQELAANSNQIMFDLGKQHGLQTWLNYGNFGDLLFQSRSGDASALERLAKALDVYTATGEWLFVPFFKTEQVRELVRHGQIEAALQAGRDVLEIVERTSERWYLPELHRLHGEIYANAGDMAEAEKHMQLSISSAQAQSARTFELRASTDLARLWAGRGEDALAAQMLQPVYDWFTEGFDSADLKDARALLDRLES